MELTFQKKFVVCGLQGLNLRIPDIFHVGSRNKVGNPGLEVTSCRNTVTVLAVCY